VGFFHWSQLFLVVPGSGGGCNLVELRGLEPLTPGLQSRCSPN
jgi:hypothetical protein